VDLLLIHWPNPSIPIEETLEGFSKLVEKEKVRSIGVSNFIRRRLKEAIGTSEKDESIPVITVDQVECHPFLSQEKLKSFCDKEEIALTAYSPLAQGKVLHHSTLEEIGKRKEKNPAQIALRWQIQRGVLVIPKASSKDHLESNMDIFDWELTDEEMSLIDGIAEKERIRLIGSDFADFEEDL